MEYLGQVKFKIVSAENSGISAMDAPLFLTFLESDVRYLVQKVFRIEYLLDFDSFFP